MYVCVIKVYVYLETQINVNIVCECLHEPSLRMLTLIEFREV